MNLLVHKALREDDQPPEVQYSSGPDMCLLQPMAQQHMSITIHSGQAMTRSSIMGDSVFLYPITISR